MQRGRDAGLGINQHNHICGITEEARRGGVHLFINATPSRHCAQPHAGMGG